MRWSSPQAAQGLCALCRDRGHEHHKHILEYGPSPLPKHLRQAQVLNLPMQKFLGDKAGSTCSRNPHL